MDSKLKRDVILEHYQNPINKGLVDEDGYIKVNTRNSSCVDNIDVMVKIVDNKIVDVRFDGEACAICTSATSVMIKTLIGKTIDESKNIIINFEKMINEEKYEKDILEDLNIYDEIYKQPSRKKCALLPFESIRKVIEK